MKKIFKESLQEYFTPLRWIYDAVELLLAALWRTIKKTVLGSRGSNHEQ